MQSFTPQGAFRRGLSCNWCRLKAEQDLVRQTESVAIVEGSALQDAFTQLLVYRREWSGLHTDVLGQVCEASVAHSSPGSLHQ